MERNIKQVAEAGTGAMGIRATGGGLGLGMEQLATAQRGGVSQEERRELWERLAGFQVDEIDARVPFSARLAREQGWSRSFARRVIDEYKKFLYLGCVLEQPVTPSEQVDAAWHLHMIYTRSYWDDLCARVLRRPFHHGPSKGGASEDMKFHDWYERTLAAYEACFGCKPPSDIWPAPEQRFESRGRWVDLNTHWVIPKRLGWLGSKRVGIAGGVGVASLAMAGCGVTLGQASGAKVGQTVLLIGVAVVLIGVVAAIVMTFLRGATPRKRPSRRGDYGDGFTPVFFLGDGSGDARRHGDGSAGSVDSGQRLEGPGGDGQGGDQSGADGSGESDGGGGDGGGGGGDGGGGGCGGGGCGGS
jgi:hypothetical protein